MQYKLSKSDWLRIGEESGWLKKAGPSGNIVSQLDQRLQALAQQIVASSGSDPQKTENAIRNAISSQRLDANGANRLRTIVSQVAQQQAQSAAARWNKAGRPGAPAAPVGAPAAGAAAPGTAAPGAPG